MFLSLSIYIVCHSQMKSFRRVSMTLQSLTYAKCIATFIIGDAADIQSKDKQIFCNVIFSAYAQNRILCFFHLHE